MCSTLEGYLTAFSRLRIDRNRKTWSRLTNHGSPYKPFLLLAIFDHIASGRIAKNFIEPTFELVRTFLGYTALLPDLNRQPLMSYPFYYLESSGFWHLLVREDQRHDAGRAVKTMSQLRRLYHGARFDDNLFPLLQMASHRHKLKECLITTFFAADFQEKVRNQSAINCLSDRYSFALLGLAEKTTEYRLAAEGSEQSQKVRDQGFRKAIVQLYDHRCALCGIRMQTPDGRTAVDAAHIVPWRESHDDQPTNGMALCKLCHWSFDEGLMSVDRRYQVQVSPAVRIDSNLPGHIMSLADRPMLRPNESRFWPDQQNLSWHRKHSFKK